MVFAIGKEGSFMALFKFFFLYVASWVMKPIMCKATRFYAIVALVDQYSLPRH
jgi:hypothetical protein